MLKDEKHIEPSRKLPRQNAHRKYDEHQRKDEHVNEKVKDDLVANDDGGIRSLVGTDGASAVDIETRSEEKTNRWDEK